MGKVIPMLTPTNRRFLEETISDLKKVQDVVGKSHLPKSIETVNKSARRIITAGVFTLASAFLSYAQFTQEPDQEKVFKHAVTHCDNIARKSSFPMSPVDLSYCEKTKAVEIIEEDTKSAARLGSVFAFLAFAGTLGTIAGAGLLNDKIRRRDEIKQGLAKTDESLRLLEKRLDPFA